MESSSEAYASRRGLDLHPQPAAEQSTFRRLIQAMSCCSSGSIPRPAPRSAQRLPDQAEVEVHAEEDDGGLHVLSSKHIVIDGFREGRGDGDGGGNRVAASAARGEGEGEGEGSESQDLEKREVSIRDALLEDLAKDEESRMGTKSQELSLSEKSRSVAGSSKRGRSPRRGRSSRARSSASTGSPQSATSSTTPGSTTAPTSVGGADAPPAGDMAGVEASQIVSNHSDDLSWVTKEKIMTLGDVEARPKTTEQLSAPLAWVIASAEEVEDASSSEGVSLMSRTGTESSSVALEAASKAGARVQIQLEDGWRDVPRLEFKQMRDHLLGGAVRFTIQARKAMYIIDFSSLESATQTNAATGRKRALRILDRNPNEQLQQDNRGADAGLFGSGSPEDTNARQHASREVLQQEALGPQSKRGGAIQFQLTVLQGNDHAEACFAQFARREEQFCGEWAAFYHSYSFAALIYEVHAAFGKVLFKFNSAEATLPRILVKEFGETGGAEALMRKFSTKFASERGDHHPEYRAVAISAMCSLVALGPEASPPVVFIAGYSQNDLSFPGVLEKLLESCYVPKAQIKKVASSIISLCEDYGLDVSQFGGQPCESRMAGHLLQIFIKRSLVDRLAYAAKPWGAVDSKRQPLSKWLDGDSNTSYGQARIVAHPKLFMHPGCVRMYVASADPKFHRTRQKFQEELTKLLDVVLGDPDLRKKAVAGIHGGTMPAWWVDSVA